MLYAVLILATLLTSLISGILSMAGGLILMGVFGFFLSVPAAMVLHGVAQAVSNGSRIVFHRHHIRSRLLLPYAAGAFVVLLVFIAFSFVPNKGLMFILIGLLPFAALVMPRRLHLDIERPPIAFCAGLIVTTAQMLAGASGPVLDVFYVHSQLTRYEILATKAVTQTLGHLVKLGYYGFFLTAGATLPWWIFAGVVMAALIGNWLGKIVVDRLHDEQFRRYGRYAIMGVGVVYIGKGVVEIVTSS